MAIKQITSGNSPITLSANDFSQFADIDADKLSDVIEEIKGTLN